MFYHLRLRKNHTAPTENKKEWGCHNRTPHLFCAHYLSCRKRREGTQGEKREKNGGRAKGTKTTTTCRRWYHCRCCSLLATRFLMGGQSQSRKSLVKAMKAKATRTKNAFGMSPTSRKKAIQQLEATHSRAKQHTMHGQRSQSVADGTKVCRACLMKAQGAVYKKGHDITHLSQI